MAQLSRAGRRRRWTIVRVVSAVAVVLVIAGVLGVLSLRSHPSRFVPPGGDGTVSATLGQPAAASARLRVRVALFGGPEKPSGGAALVNSPARGVAVTVTGGGRRAAGTTDRHGVAVFMLPPGRYRYTSSECSTGFGHHEPVTLATGRVMSVEIRCPVP